MRLRCWLLGCRFAPLPDDPPTCSRCGAMCIDEEGLNPPWQRVLHRLARWCRFVRHRCEECGKPMWFDRSPFCCYRCCVNNLPF